MVMITNYTLYLCHVVLYLMASFCLKHSIGSSVTIVCLTYVSYLSDITLIYQQQVGFTSHAWAAQGWSIPTTAASCLLPMNVACPNLFTRGYATKTCNSSKARVLCYLPHCWCHYKCLMFPCLIVGVIASVSCFLACCVVSLAIPRLG